MTAPSPQSPPPSSPAAVRRTAHALSTGAIGWLHANRERGAFAPDVTGELTDPDSVYKPLGESVLAASLVLREGIASPTDRRAAESLMEFAWAQLREGDLLYERQLRYMMMTDPLELYTHFARAGFRHDRLHALFNHLGGLTSRGAAEQLPNRRLAVANASRVAGLDRQADWSVLTDATWLGQTPEPWAIDWMTAYCVTHTVFHVTDWGGRPDALSPRIQDYLGRWLPVWIDIWQEIQEWDLVAELLIVDACLPEPRSAPEVWERLAAVQRPDGLVPRNGEPVTEDPDEAFREHQHTTVVAAVAGTLALSRHRGARALV
ncbi:DUF6895 family protein [Streptomyces marincola]|uniref:DUF6895 family protein n=1 Tax=Streptomyces marincola TaxID=2878388 RepID=UPI001CF59E47|nr:hypothetical protein [Streptomyces marincola]UCM90423.1 hypothetical protein LC193_22195 [Streptomyces marincola]